MGERIQPSSIFRLGRAIGQHPFAATMSLFALLLLIPAIYVINNDHHDAAESVRSEPATAKEPPKKNLQKWTACIAELARLQKKRVLYHVKPAVRPIVEVGPHYYSLSFDDRAALAETVNCYLVQGSTDKWNFDLVDYRSHAVVNVWKYGRLRTAD